MALFIIRVSAFMSSLHDGQTVFGALPFVELAVWYLSLSFNVFIYLPTYAFVCSKYLEQRLTRARTFPVLRKVLVGQRPSDD